VPEIEGADAIDQAILQALDEAPFASLRQLAKRILIPMTTIRYHLVNRMGYKVKHSKWVPHSLSEAQKATRVTTSRSLLARLQSIRHQGWQYIVTLDEAWFSFSNQHEQIWLPGIYDPP
jgi:histone-lysine N-methyltransferase SETMAR